MNPQSSRWSGKLPAEDDTVASVELGELLEDTVRFLRNDIASKQLKLASTVLVNLSCKFRGANFASSSWA